MTQPLSPLRVLAIDDHPIILRTLNVVLGGMGITNVDDAATVEIAEEKLRDGPAYDVIFCDLNLPGKDGIEFLRGKRAALAGTGIVLLSGEDERILHSVTAMGRAAGLNVLAALTKPATATKVADAMAMLGEVVPGRRKAPREVMPSPRHITEMLASEALSMHFQPKVRLSDGELVGVEALLRGKHPELGDLDASAIVRSADAQDRGGEIARVVFEGAVAAAGHFRADGLQLSMSINVDGGAIRQQLPDMLADLAQRHDVPLASLALEFSEPSVSADYVNALDVTTRLRLKRCALALDHFGTSASSLQQLHDLPFTELKIDRSFVAGCDTRPASRRMISAMVGLGRAFGMTTTAVGVETEGEWAALKQLGVDQAQGYIVSGARPASQLGDWITEWTLRQR